MDWTVIALITAALFVLYSVYQVAVAFRLVPHTRNGRPTGPTFSPGEAMWLVLASLIYAGLWINALT
jgi:hypothetical protein